MLIPLFYRVLYISGAGLIPLTEVQLQQQENPPQNTPEFNLDINKIDPNSCLLKHQPNDCLGGSSGSSSGHS